MKADKDNVTALVKTFGYTLVHNRRKNRQKELGGGVVFFAKFQTTVQKNQPESLFII